MVGGYQILDLSNYEFIYDSETGDATCHVDGAYHTVMQKNKPIMLSCVNYTGASGVREVYPSQFTAFNLIGDEFVCSFGVGNQNITEIHVNPQDYVYVSHIG